MEIKENVRCAINQGKTNNADGTFNLKWTDKYSESAIRTALENKIFDSLADVVIKDSIILCNARIFSTFLQDSVHFRFAPIVEKSNKDNDEYIFEGYFSMLNIPLYVSLIDSWCDEFVYVGGNAFIKEVNELDTKNMKTFKIEYNND